MRRNRPALSRRQFITAMSSLGVATGFADRLLARNRPITSVDVAATESLVGVDFTPGEREMMLRGLEDLRSDYEALREVILDDAVLPALRFDPSPPVAGPEVFSPAGLEAQPTEIARPGTSDDLAFLSAVELGRLVQAGEISCRELTQLYLERLERLDGKLQSAITVTMSRALDTAERLDVELSRGLSRGPLHGVPWGAKDLLAAAGYPTTWGAAPYRDQVFPEDATVVRRLEEAGAVLVAKLSLGALAWGDAWFGGTTRNPWKLEQGASGSSAGSAAATAAGLVGFSLGSETWGSIVSPATRCGVTGLRPTFGRVSRDGAMSLAWSMDKIGPMARSVEDCAIILQSILGADGRDPTAVDAPFEWPPREDPRHLRVGWVPELFEAAPQPGQEEWHRLDLETLEVLRSLGWELVPIRLPDLPVGPLALILTAEASAAFDELTRSGRDDLLVRQVENAWPNVFRQGRTIPAVEYLRANRVRSLLATQMTAVFREVDLYVAPSFGGDNLLLTNLTGHPAVVVPNGFRPDGTPTSISFIGDLWRESELLAVARRYQEATSFHRHHPQL